MNGQNKGEAAGPRLRMTVLQDIDVGLVVPNVAGAPLMLAVRVKLDATASEEKVAEVQALCAGEYEAKFYFPKDVSEEMANGWLEDRDYQYVLVAQAFPLAMTHFRRELQSMGLDASELPLGLASD